MIRVSARFAGLLMMTLVVAGCGKKVTRVSSDSTIDLSGRWNDTDSRLVAEEMLRDALNAAWYYPYQSQKRTPTVIVGEVRNRSHEHISTETFIKDMERTLINSGKVDFVANKTERQQLRDEKADQSTNASVQTRNKAGEESGAELMLIGSINSIVDSEGGKSVVFYQVNMELVSIETGRKVWLGDKKIKKYVTRGSVKP
jgi:uncharacterized protein (TIGR02722 family)